MPQQMKTCFVVQVTCLRGQLAAAFGAAALAVVCVDGAVCAEWGLMFSRHLELGLKQKKIVEGKI